MRFEIYGKQNCGKCSSTKDKLGHVVEKSGQAAEVVFVDLDTIVGRAEGAFYDIHQVPTTIVRSPRGNEVTRFRGIVPPSEAVRDLLAAPPA